MTNEAHVGRHTGRFYFGNFWKRYMYLVVCHWSKENYFLQLKFINMGMSFRWSFGPNSAWGSIVNYHPYHVPQFIRSPVTSMHLFISFSFCIAQHTIFHVEVKISSILDYRDHNKYFLHRSTPSFYIGSR